eukprot:436836-Hanusia_phi.AAC.3
MQQHFCQDMQVFGARSIQAFVEHLTVSGRHGEEEMQAAERNSVTWSGVFGSFAFGVGSDACRENSVVGMGHKQRMMNKIPCIEGCDFEKCKNVFTKMVSVVWLGPALDFRVVTTSCIRKGEWIKNPFLSMRESEFLFENGECGGSIARSCCAQFCCGGTNTELVTHRGCPDVLLPSVKESGGSWCAYRAVRDIQKGEMLWVAYHGVRDENCHCPVVEVKKSGIAGAHNGLFARKDLCKDTIIGIYTGAFHAGDEDFDGDSILHVTDKPIFVSEGEWERYSRGGVGMKIDGADHKLSLWGFEGRGIMSYINHSVQASDRNVYYRSDAAVITLKAVKKGEFTGYDRMARDLGWRGLERMCYYVF